MKTRGQIIRENVCTLFNFLNVTIAILLFAAGAYSNMAFILIVIANVVIGIVQELKARKMVEELSLLNRPKATVLRGGFRGGHKTGSWELFEKSIWTSLAVCTWCCIGSYLGQSVAAIYRHGEQNRHVCIAACNLHDSCCKKLHSVYKASGMYLYGNDCRCHSCPGNLSNLVFTVT